MAFSTGVTLLTISNPQSLVDFWEFDGSTSYRGANIGTSGCTISGSKLEFSSSSPSRALLHNLLTSTGTFVGWYTNSTFEDVAVVSTSTPLSVNWFNGGSPTVVGLDLCNSSITRRQSGGSQTVNSLGTLTHSTGTLGKFIAFSWEQVLPNQLFKVYDSSGAIIGSTSLAGSDFGSNLGIIGAPSVGGDGAMDNVFVRTFDKVCTYNKILSPAEISYLFNSGNGRTAEEAASL